MGGVVVGGVVPGGVVVGPVIVVLFEVPVVAPVPVVPFCNPPAGTVLPKLQSTFELPGVASELPRKPVDSATGLPLVFEFPAHTRTTTRFMSGIVVSK
jgi:hypothetical protein